MRATEDPGRHAPVTDDPLSPEPIAHWPGELVDLPVGQVYVRRAPAQPAAEPAVFVHGLGGSSTNWTDLMDLLSRPTPDRPGARVLACVALDLPGFGLSAPPQNGSYSIDTHASAVIELIEAMGSHAVHLISNSMGGAVSTRVAARRPDLVRTMTLVSPALPDLRPRPLPIRLALAAIPGLGSAILRWASKLPAETRTDRALRDVYTDPGVVHPSRRRAEIEEVLRRDTLIYASHALIMSARSLVTEYFKVGKKSLWSDVARISAPALILHGSHDRLVNPVMAGKAARAFPVARVLVLPGVGHVAMMERPTLVVAEIRAFLDWAEAEGVAAGSSEAAARSSEAATSTYR